MLWVDSASVSKDEGDPITVITSVEQDLSTFGDIDNSALTAFGQISLSSLIENQDGEQT